MVDEYYDVSVNRISPEFPMPIMTSRNDVPNRKPGGVANVGYQFRHFNVDTRLVCFVDDLMLKVNAQHGLTDIPKYRASINAFGGHVPIKRRFLDNGIQVKRWDVEDEFCGLPKDDETLYEIQLKLMQHRRMLPIPDVAILSDYNKGFFSTMDHSEEVNWIDSLRDVTTIVDPKIGPLSKWRGCTIFKPNAKEARELSQKNTWREQAKFFQNNLECEAVVITYGGEKVCGVWKDDFFIYKPDKSVEVESVVGAGDCFCAFFAMAVGHGFTVPEAAEIAWKGGAVYVQQGLNRPVIPADLVESGMVDPQDLVSRDFTLAFANGCFDLLHGGHLNTLKHAYGAADKVVVAVNTDSSVKRLKGGDRPIQTLLTRMEVLAALQWVDYVIPFTGDTPLKLIKLLKPDVLVKGAEYKESEIVGADLVPKVVRACMIPGLSTTKIIDGSCDDAS